MALIYQQWGGPRAPQLAGTNGVPVGIVEKHVKKGIRKKKKGKGNETSSWRRSRGIKEQQQEQQG